jgi:hypothetical protein
VRGSEREWEGVRRREGEREFVRGSRFVGVLSFQQQTPFSYGHVLFK